MKYLRPAAPLLALITLTPALGAGNAFNPDTSLNLLTIYKQARSGKNADNGFALQEAEMQFTADVDPYFRASALFSVAPEGAGWGIDPEEVFAETTAIPRVTLKAGRFKSAIGRHNTLHTHAFPFIDAPLINAYLLGDEGVRDQGLSAAALLPTPWFAELTVQAGAGESGTLFNSPSRNDLAGVYRLRNLWELSEATTLEWGLSAANGRNAQSGTSKLLGTDLTLKHRPTEGGKYRSLQWTAEILWADRAGRDDAQAASLADQRRLGGFGTWALYQFAERWHGGLRYDLAGFNPAPGLAREQRGSAILAYSPSEFSEVRAQYAHLARAGGAHDDSLMAQLNFSIGAHPAHAY